MALNIAVTGLMNKRAQVPCQLLWRPAVAARLQSKLCQPPRMFSTTVSTNLTPSVILITSSSSRRRRRRRQWASTSWTRGSEPCRRKLAFPADEQGKLGTAGCSSAALFGYVAKTEKRLEKYIKSVVGLDPENKPEDSIPFARYVLVWKACRK